MEVFSFGHSKKQLRPQLTWFAAWLGVTGVAAYLTPDRSGHGTHQQLGLPPCPSVLLFDRPCPGCGLTTSWTAFIHGDFAEAFHAHPLGPPMYLIFTISAFLALYGFFKGGRLNTDSKLYNRYATVAVVGFVLFGLIRMGLTPHYGTPTERIVAKFAGP